MLKKIIFAVMFLCASVLSASAEEKKEVYVNGIDSSFPPFAFMGEDGKPAGFDVEAMNWIADKMGFTVEHKAMDWNTIIPSLKSKRIDMVCSGMSVNAERKKEVAFSNPYYQSHPVFVILPDSKLTKEEVLTGNKKLGIQRGTSEAQWLVKNKDKNKWNYTLQYYDNQTMAIEDLFNARVEVIALDDTSAFEAISKGKKMKILATYGEPTDFAVAVRKEDKELLKKINEGYKLLQADKHWKELEEKYGLAKDSKAD